MTVLEKDLVFLKHENMTDSDDGGGLPTSRKIDDGASNNLFPDVSDIDAMMGKVRLRKISIAVNTANNELVQGARLVFLETSKNKNMSIFGFKSTGFADRRKDAQNAIENYLAFGVRFAGHVNETQLVGQAIIQQIIDVEAEAPAVGQAMVIVQNEGQPDQFFQYVRVMKVTTEIQTFVVDKKSVKKKSVIIEISEPLRYQFTGPSVQEYEENNFDKKRVAYLRDARNADAARYYSATRLAKPITALSVNRIDVESIYAQIVPSSQVETPLAQVDPSNQIQAVLQTSDSKISYTSSITISSSEQLFLGSAVAPNTFEIEIDGILYTDKGKSIVDASGKSIGVIDYSMGLITWASTVNFGLKSAKISFAPAAKLTKVSDTDYLVVPEVDAGFKYIKTLPALPAPGSVVVTYQVTGNIYKLIDNGSGILESQITNGGVGTVDYKTGTIIITTGAIPDSNSIIVFSYAGTFNQYRLANTQAYKGLIFIPIPDKIIDNASLTLAWSGLTASANELGVITGAAYGRVFDGMIIITPENLPEKNTEVTVKYTTAVVKTTEKTHDGLSNSIEILVPGIGELDKNSVILTTDLSVDAPILMSGMALGGQVNTLSSKISVKIKDNGLGKMIIANFEKIGDLPDLEGKEVGTIDYQQRKIILNPLIKYTTVTQHYQAPPMLSSAPS